ncbi:hypothetical protein PAAG_03332 [Paracoccidioides lutzii Pb01]|uniref:Uncharacterized protein n=1 Tax=Paracoccidioides lutzii (strain ATCC MYA-826 / Pb01) TaxID=502779 RepID=C1GWV8_PARBA|nr:hypothetical protein PAAG_03332 [Paracoccidioides lutzii Pb01]EEH41046.1 hypothetical protein PAAG_03332 [Paracoccidioides lutzii Pb01]
MAPRDLSSLPPEIILNIVRNMKKSSHRLNLALCSRYFYDIVIPFVSENIRLVEPDIQVIVSLVQTLLRSPRIASRTYTLEINIWETEQNYDINIGDSPETLPRPMADLRIDSSLINEAVQRLFTPSDEPAPSKLMAHLRAGNEDAWVALLLFSVPRLQKLSLIVPYNTDHVLRLVRRAAVRVPPFDTRPALNHLSHLHVEWWDTEGYLNSLFVWPFYFFPSMQSVTCKKIGDPPLYRGEEDMVTEEGDEGGNLSKDHILSLENLPRASQVTQISITKSHTGDGMFSKLHFCEKLKSFKFEHCDSYSYYSSFQPTHFFHGLSLARHTLEHLWLAYDYDSYDGDEHYEGDNDAFGSLTHFVVLKTLTMSAINLIGKNYLLDRDDLRLRPAAAQRLAQVLPTSLESLSMIHIEEKQFIPITLQVENLLQPTTLSACTPRLALVNLLGVFCEWEVPPTTYRYSERTPVFRPDVLHRAAELNDMCASVGVKFGIMDTRVAFFAETEGDSH